MKTTIVILFGIFLWVGSVSAQDFQRNLEGTVGKAKVQVELTKVGQDLSGSYYYEKYGTPIMLKGRLTKSKVTLKEDKGATFEGDFGKDGSFQGQWISKDRKKTLPVSLKQCADTVFFTIHSKDWKWTGKKNSMECEFGRYYLHPAGYGDGKSLDKLKGAVWGFFFSGADVAAAKGDPAKAIDLESRGFRADCVEADKDGPVGAGHMETTRTMSTLYNEKGILTVKTESWSYTGGTRGDATLNFAVIDLSKGALLTLKDIFKDGSEGALAKIVARKLVEDADDPKVRNLKDAGYPKFKEGSLNDPEFYVTDEGIGFVYNLYTLGNTNQPDILVPFKEIGKDHFRPESAVYKLAFGQKKGGPSGP